MLAKAAKKASQPSCPITRIWNLYEITGNDDSAASPEDVQMAADMGMTVTMTLNEDGTGSFDMFGEIMNVTWEETADGCTIYLEGSPAPATITGDGMISVDVGNGQVMVFQQTSSAGSNSTGIAA